MTNGPQTKGLECLLEARQIAILRHPKTGQPVGKLYLWETGEADPMWFGDEVLNAIADPLPGESQDWANWHLAGTSGPDD